MRCEIVTVEWPDGKPSGGRLQPMARAARYKLLSSACVKHGIDVLATAHHVEDQAETFLMRLSHASAIGGLKGMERVARRIVADLPPITIWRHGGARSPNQSR